MKPSVVCWAMIVGSLLSVEAQSTLFPALRTVTRACVFPTNAVLCSLAVQNLVGTIPEIITQINACITANNPQNGALIGACIIGVLGR